MKAALVVVLVLLASVAFVGSAGDSPQAPHPRTAPDVAVSRYNLQRTGVATDAFDIPWDSYWSFLTNGTSATAALATDVDGDGNLELFFGEMRSDGADRENRQGYVVDRDGRLRYSLKMHDDSYAAVAADLDGDGLPELVFSEGLSDGAGFRVFHGAGGSPLWNVSIPFRSGHVPGSPAVVDADGDGLLDLVASSTDGAVYALRGTDGSLLWKTPLPDPVGTNAVPVGDLDGDGFPEVVVQTQAGVVYVLNATSGANRWSLNTGGHPLPSLALADLDGDGHLEVVVGQCGSGGLVAIRSNGTVLWRKGSISSCDRAPALVDVSGDTLPDVVAVDTAADQKLVAFRGTDGTVLWEASESHARGGQPLVAAVMDDGQMYVLVPWDPGPPGYIMLHNAATGVAEWIILVLLDRSTYGESLVRDLDGDGMAEMAIAAGDGRLYVLVGRGSAPGNRPPIPDAGPAYEATEGDTVTFTAEASTDPDGDSLTFRWDFDGDGNWDTAWTPEPTASWVIGDDFSGIARVEVSDGNATAVAEAPLLVRNRDPAPDASFEVRANDPRTQGYWNRQCSPEPPSRDHVGIPQTFVDFIAAHSRVFSGIPDKAAVCDILAGRSEGRLARAELQLMALWLNVASGKLDPSTPVNSTIAAATTVEEAVREAEDILLSGPSDAEIDRAKDIADDVNNGLGVVRAMVVFRASATDAGSDDIIFSWDFRDGTNESRSYYNDGVGPDPERSPDGTFPFVAGDEVTHGFWSHGVYRVVLGVSDDDGGFAKIELVVALSA